MELQHQLAFMIPMFILEAIGSFRFMRPDSAKTTMNTGASVPRDRRITKVILWTAIYTLTTTMVFIVMSSDFIFHDVIWVLLRGGLWWLFCSTIYRYELRTKAFLAISYLAAVHLSRYIIISVGVFLNDILYEILQYKISESLANGSDVEQVMELVEWGSVALYLIVVVPMYGLILWGYRRIIQRIFNHQTLRLLKGECLTLIWPGIVSIVIVLTLRVLIGSGGYAENPLFSYLVPIISLFLLAMNVAQMTLYQRMKKYQQESAMRSSLERQVVGLRHEISEAMDVYTDMRTLKHDLRGHIANISALVSTGEQSENEIREYLEKMKQTVTDDENIVHTGNPVTDVILNRFRVDAEREEVTFSSEFYFPSEKGGDAYDIGIILNNALDNALEASEKCSDGRFIEIRSYIVKDMFFIEVSNSYHGDIRFNTSGLPLSSKIDPDSHGLGIAAIKRQAEKYMGGIDMEIDEERRVFKLVVFLKME